MSLFTKHRTRVGLGIVTIAALAALTACASAPEPESSATPSSTSTPEAEPYSGPVVFVGDELSALLPTAEEILAAIPGASDVSAPSDALEQVSDGFGYSVEPAICATLAMEQSLSSLGARTTTWAMPGDNEYSINRVSAFQFADEAQAQTRMDQLLETAAQCAEFQAEGPNTFTAAVAEPVDDVEALAGTWSANWSTGDWRFFVGFASVGNTLVELRTSIADDEADHSAIAQLLQSRAVAAKDALVEQLSAQPPVEPEAPQVDASSPWGEWPITGFGVGPVMLGVSLEDAIAAVPGAVVTEAAYENGPVTLTNSETSQALTLDTTEDGRVSGITVGFVQGESDPAVDGSALPSALDVRIGDLASDAYAAHPGGTRVHVISSGQYGYLVGDRQGRLLMFQTERAAQGSSDARIIGIAVYDATLWADLSVE